MMVGKRIPSVSFWGNRAADPLGQLRPSSRRLCTSAHPSTAEELMRC